MSATARINVASAVDHRLSYDGELVSLPDNRTHTQTLLSARTWAVKPLLLFVNASGVEVAAEPKRLTQMSPEGFRRSFAKPNPLSNTKRPSA